MFLRVMFDHEWLSSFLMELAFGVVVGGLFLVLVYYLFVKRGVRMRYVGLLVLFGGCITLILARLFDLGGSGAVALILGVFLNLLIYHQDK